MDIIKSDSNVSNGSKRAPKVAPMAPKVAPTAPMAPAAPKVSPITFHGIDAEVNADGKKSLYAPNLLHSLLVLLRDQQDLVKLP